MRNLITAHGLRIRKYWLVWALLVLFIVILVLQVRGKLNTLRTLEETLSTLPEEMSNPMERLLFEEDQLTLAHLQRVLRYPAVIGYAVQLSTGAGWFFIIVLTAIVGGEDFTRGTLRAVLVRGAGRVRFLLSQCLVLWLVAGIAIALVLLLAAISGPFIHRQVTTDPISFNGLGDALLIALRAWLTCLPFISATLFWAVLARSGGPALGVGVGLHFIEVLMEPFVLVTAAIFGTETLGIPLLFRWQGSVLGIMLGYNSSIFLHWGFPLTGMTVGIVGALADMGRLPLVHTDPWRATATLAGYTLLFLGLAIQSFRRRDITYAT